MDLELILMAVGFSLAAYSIVANDAIQTLGISATSFGGSRPYTIFNSSQYHFFNFDCFCDNQSCL